MLSLLLLKKLYAEYLTLNTFSFLIVYQDMACSITHGKLSKIFRDLDKCVNVLLALQYTWIY